MAGFRLFFEFRVYRRNTVKDSPRPSRTAHGTGFRFCRQRNASSRDRFIIDLVINGKSTVYVCTRRSTGSANKHNDVYYLRVINIFIFARLNEIFDMRTCITRNDNIGCRENTRSRVVFSFRGAVETTR